MSSLDHPKPMVFDDHPKPMVFDGTLERHPRSSFEDGLQLHPSIDQFEAWGRGLLGRPCLNL